MVSHALIGCTIKYFTKRYSFTKLSNSEIRIWEEGLDLWTNDSIEGVFSVKVRVMDVVRRREVTRNLVKGILKCWQTCLPELEGCLYFCGELILILYCFWDECHFCIDCKRNLRWFISSFSECFTTSFPYFSVSFTLFPTAVAFEWINGTVTVTFRALVRTCYNLKKYLWPPWISIWKKALLKVDLVLYLC